MAPLELSRPGPVITPPRARFVAGWRLRVTAPATPPPERPAPVITAEMVPMPGGATLRVPSGAIVTLAPALTPPRLEVVAGRRFTVPVDVIVVGGSKKPVPKS